MPDTTGTNSTRMPPDTGLNSGGISTPCAICDIYGEADEMYPARLVGAPLDETTFSARRTYHERFHFRIVQCRRCGLLRSDPVTLAQEKFVAGYQMSRLTYEGEIDNLCQTYGFYISRLEQTLPGKDNILEIGCGNGFFLEEALNRGFKHAYGVEPSHDAVRKASPRVRPGIKVGMFSRDLFPANFFDLICIFQTMDHLLDPSGVLRDCLVLLKPGGLILAINHNARAVSARILGERSPIFDIQHTYLYDAATMRKLFEKSGFAVLNAFSVKNKFSMEYLLFLLPLKPQWLKEWLQKGLSVGRLSRVAVFLPIGNVGLIAQKRSY